MSEEVETKYPAYRWVVIGSWMTGHIMAFTVIMTLGFLLPAIREDMGLSPLQEGWLSSSALISNIVLVIPLSWLMTRFSAKAITTITLFIGGFLVLLQGWAPIFALLLVGRLLYGTTVIAREPARAMLVQQWVPPKEILLVNAFISAFWGVASAVGFLLTPTLLGLLDGNWRSVMYVFGFTTFGLVVLWLILGKERITTNYQRQFLSQDRNPLRSVLGYRELWLLGAGMLGANITWMAFLTFWPTYLMAEYGISLFTSGWMFTISGIVSAAGGIPIGLFALSRRRHKTILWVSGLVVVATSLGLLWAGSIPLLVLISVVNGASWAFFPILMTIPFQLPRIKPREIAVAIGFVEMLMYAGGAIGPILTGYLQQVSGGDIRFALAVASLCSLSLTATGLLLPVTKQRRVQPQEEMRVKPF